MLHCRADVVAKLEYSRRVVIPPRLRSWRTVKVKYLLLSERLSRICDGFCGASEQEAEAFVTRRLADSNLERIRRLVLNLKRLAWRRVEMVRLFCSLPL